jgi:hypothetical protein
LRVASLSRATSTPLLGFLAWHGVALMILRLLPINQWPHAIWQAFAGSLSAAAVLVGVRRYRVEGALAWYLIAAGLCLSAWGTLVEMIAWRAFAVATNPNAADALWLALYPALLGGLGILTHRRAATEDMGTMMLYTLICVLLNLFVGVLAWELIVWRTQSDPSLTLANRVVVTIYPLADLIVLALMLRLLLAGGFRSATCWLMTAALLAFFAADVGWAGFLRGGTLPDGVKQYLLEATSLSARALVAAAALHPAMSDVTPATKGRAQPLGGFGWAGLLASALIAPAVIVLQAVLDLLYSVSGL